LTPLDDLKQMLNIVSR